jgi:hypothetical protein
MDQQLHPPLRITTHHISSISSKKVMEEIEQFLQRPSHGDEGVDSTVRVQLSKLRDALETTEYYYTPSSSQHLISLFF